MNNEKPLDYCDNKSIIPYGDNRSAPSFKDTVNEVSVWKDQKHNSSNRYFDTKLKELQEEYEKLLEEYKLNEMVYNAQCRFSPVIGEVYHLYQRGDGSSFLSMIDPKQWQTVGDRYRKDFDFVGSFKLTSNNKWEKV